MITVTLTMRNKCIYAFTVSGHANTAPYGQDLVCAAVTAVTVGTINAIEDLLKVKPELTINSQAGFIHCDLSSMETASEVQVKLQVLLRGFVVSLETIKNDANNSLTIKYKN